MRIVESHDQAFSLNSKGKPKAYRPRLAFKESTKNEVVPCYGEFIFFLIYLFIFTRVYYLMHAG